MTIQIKGNQYDIDREALELLVERDNPAGWIAQTLLVADNRTERDEATTSPPEVRA